MMVKVQIIFYANRGFSLKMRLIWYKDIFKSMADVRVDTLHKRVHIFGDESQRHPPEFGGLMEVSKN